MKKAFRSVRLGDAAGRRARACMSGGVADELDDDHVGLSGVGIEARLVEVVGGGYTAEGVGDSLFRWSRAMSVPRFAE